MNLNRVTFAGRVVGETRLCPNENQVPVLHFMLSLSEGWESRRTERTGMRTDHAICRLHGARGEGLSPHLSDGKRLYVEGKYRREVRPAGPGTGARSEVTVYIEVTNVEFLNGRDGSDE